MKNTHQLHFAAQGLCIYHHLLQDEYISRLLRLLAPTPQTPQQAAADYGSLYALLCSQQGAPSLSQGILNRVLYADNAFTRGCAADFNKLPPHIITAARSDLATLSALASVTCQGLQEHLAQQYPDYAALFLQLPQYPAGESAAQLRDIAALAAHYKKNGFGIFAKSKAFTLDVKQGLQLLPVGSPDGIRLSQLMGYARERETIIDNTLSLLAGQPANNILLYGDRGTGKSSTVKAVLNEFAPKGLRLVEVPKHQLPFLGQVIDQLADVPLKFIIFIDDLSFSDSDDSYTVLKAVLEGSVSKRPDNMVLYATSNRRHLVRETFSSRQGDEVHLADTRDEAASLSDRFGITVTFLAPDKLRYLALVADIARQRNLSVEEDTLAAAANRWASHRGSFSPRTASQFVDWACSRTARGLSL